MSPLEKERSRLSALQAVNIMDTAPEAAYDDITRLASFICNAPIAYISFLDDKRQWYKSSINIPFPETTLEDALCAQTIHETSLVHVPDLKADPRFADNAYVNSDLGIRFYAGYPLITSEGDALGTLCVIDFNVRSLSDEQKFALEALGRQVITQLELRAAHARTAGILDSIAAPFISLDKSFRLTYSNVHTEKFLGKSQKELVDGVLWELAPELQATTLQQTVASVMKERLASSFEEYYPHNNSWHEVHVSPASDGGVSIYLRDITLRKQAEERIFQQASYDQLTGLPNRLLLSEKLKQACKHAKRHKAQCGLLFLDLNQFKSVNDTLGHQIGDKLLRAVGKRLQNAIRQEDIIARFGGDEFVIVAHHLNDRSDAEKLAKTVIKAFVEPFSIGRKKLSIGTSIGIALYPTDGLSQDELIKHADIALYKAKENRQATPYIFYEDIAS